MNKLIKKVQRWAIDKELDKADPAMQLLKIFEEVAETGQAYMRKQQDELKLEIGDILVTVIIFAMQNGIDPQESLTLAYEKIAKRKGKLVNGSFIKEEDLKDEVKIDLEAILKE